MSTALNLLDPCRQEQARDYNRLSRRFQMLEVLLGMIVLLVILLSGLSGSLRNMLAFPEPVRVAAYFIILMLVLGILSAPLSYYRSFVLAHRYGLSNQNRTSWLADQVKGESLGLVLSTSLVVIIYLFLRAFPETWWLLAFATVTLAMIVMSKLAPVIIFPLFYELEPLKDTGLRQRLLDLSERTSIRVNDISQIKFSNKTSAANAMLMGWGGTRRIALSDTLLKDYTPEEIEVIAAHEFGHQYHNDMARLIGIQAFLMFVGFYLVNMVLNWAVPRMGFQGLSDVAALPLLALVLAAAAILLAPLANYFSRRIEEAADDYALAATANPEAFSSMLGKLTNQNLIESDPGTIVELLFHDHPTYSKRLSVARRYRDEVRQ
ncbi:MAG: M48 family metallopeptidase [Dehalococcoidia bacterium]|nr:M48 family metallopeptidase [Dehalococcoidia bacterium]